jgi:phosphoribosylglycinamide formyltransferase-1
MTEQFVGEPIVPDRATYDPSRMAAGEPGLPARFSWRGQTFRVVEVLKSWRQTGSCRHGSPESYVRKHWYEVLTDSGATMKLYFERQPRSRSDRGKRWWLFSRSEPES